MWQRWVSGSLLWSFLKGLGLVEAPVQTWWSTSLPGRLQERVRPWTKTSLAARYAEPVALAILCLAIFVSPFVPTGVIGGVLILGLGCLTLLSIAQPQPLVPLALPVFAFWLSALVSLIASTRFATSLDGFLKITLYLGFFALAAHLFARPVQRTAAIAVYLLTTLPVSFYGLYQWRVGAAALATWVDPESSLADTTRVYSFLGNPNLLAAYLLAAVPLGLVGCIVWKAWAARLMAAVACLAAVVSIVLTFSRGGWIALLASSLLLLGLLAAWLGERLGPKLKVWLPTGLAAGVIVALVVVVWAVPAVAERAASIFSGRDDSSNNFRINVWAAVFDMIRAFPVTGIGPGNQTFEAIYPFFQRPKYNALSAYSIFLEVLVELGVLGALAFGWLLVSLLVQGLVTWTRRLKTDGNVLWSVAATCAAFGLLVDGATDTVWLRPSVQVIWWVVCAVVAAEFLRRQTSK